MRTTSYFLNTNPSIELILEELSEGSVHKSRLAIPCQYRIVFSDPWFNSVGICPILPDSNIKDLILLGQRLEGGWGHGYGSPPRRCMNSKLSFDELIEYIETWLRENNVSCK